MNIQKLDNLYSVYGEENVLEAIEKIENRNKEILLMYFGINRKQEDVTEIAKKFELVDVTVYKIITKELSRIELYLKYPEIDRKTFASRKSVVLIELLEKYGKDAIYEYIEKLDDKEKSVVKSYYGIRLNNDDEFKEEELENARNILMKVVDKIEGKEEIGSSIRLGRVNSKLRTIYDTYGEEEIKKAVECLDDKKKNIMKLYLGIGCESKNYVEISEITGYSPGSIQTLVDTNINKIGRIVRGMPQETLNAQKNNALKKLYKKYGKERFLSEIEALDDFEKNIIVKYYGLDESDGLKAKELAELLNIDYEEFSKILRKTLNVIDKKIGNRKDNKYIDEDFNRKYEDLCDVYGKENVDIAIGVMTGRYKELTELFFGLNGRALSIEEIVEKNAVSEKRVCEIMNECLNEVSYILADDLPNEIKELFSLYGKKNVVIAMKRLKEDVPFIEMYKNDKTDKKLLIEDLSSELENLKEERLTKRQLIYKRRQKFNNDIVTKDTAKLQRIIKGLSKLDRDLICLYYGLDNAHVCCVVDFAKKYNVSTKLMREKIQDVVNKINKLMLSESR